MVQNMLEYLTYYCSVVLCNQKLLHQYIFHYAHVRLSEGNWNFRNKELSFPGTKVPWVELSFPGTFVPMTDIKGELSFPNIGYYCLVMILKLNLNS